MAKDLNPVRYGEPAQGMNNRMEQWSCQDTQSGDEKHSGLKEDGDFSRK